MKRRSFIISSVAAGLMPALPAIAKRNGRQAIGSKGVFVANGKDRFNGEKHFGGASPNDLKVSTSDTDGGFCAFESIGNAKMGPPLHIHHEQDELFMVKEGEFTIQVGSDTFKLKPGDTLLAPRKVPHAFVQTSEGTSKLMVLFQPAGKMEEFFIAMGEIKGPPDRAVFQKLFQDHGMEIVGPPLQG